jgi:hypothetical protein
VRRYPIEPLMALTGKTQFALLEGRRVNSETWSNIRDRGFTPQMADKVACANGFHPSLVWPSWEQDEWDELSVECAECNERFVPRWPRHVYCSKGCRDAHNVKKYRRRRYAEDPEYRQRVLDKGRAYRAETVRAKRATDARYRAENAEARAERERARYHANRDAILARRRAARAAA